MLDPMTLPWSDPEGLVFCSCEYEERERNMATCRYNNGLLAEECSLFLGVFIAKMVLSM